MMAINFSPKTVKSLETKFKTDLPEMPFWVVLGMTIQYNHLYNLVVQFWGYCMNDKILDFLKQRRLTFFIGAGISMIPPSCLPSWWQVNHIILDALADESCAVIPEVKQLTDLIKEREKDGKLPPEFVAEVITERIEESYFEVLQGLEGDTPNPAHLWLATLAKAGLLTAIVTTNFDTLIERAFAMAGVALVVLVNPEEYAQMDGAGGLLKPPCKLLKLHGTATSPASCVDTLAQRKRGLHPNINRALHLLGSQTFWVFLGYSGADLASEPNYLGLRARMDNSPGFAWLHMPNTTPLPVVTELAKLYGVDRGLVEFGTLPDWLDDFHKLLPAQIAPPDSSPMPTEKAQSGRTEKLEKVKSHAQRWAKERGPQLSAVVLGDIGCSAGHYRVAQTVFQKLLEKQSDLSAFAIGLAQQQLGGIAQHFGDNEKALAHYLKAVEFFREAGHTEGMLASLQGAALIQKKFGYFAQAEKTLLNYLEYTRMGNSPDGLIYALLHLGSFYRDTGRIQDSFQLYQEATALASKHGLELLRAQGLLGMALAENSLGNLKESEQHILEAKEIYARLGDDSFLSEVLRELAQIHYYRGDIEEAFKLLQRAKIKAYLSGSKSRIVLAERIQGDFTLQLGKQAEAIPILQKAAKNAEEMGDVLMALGIWQSLGITFQSQGQLNEAAAIFQKALKKAEEGGMDVQAAGLRNNLGIVSEQRGNFQEALDYYLAADEVFNRTGQLDAMAGSKGNVANVYYRLGNYNESSKYYQEVLHIFEKIQDVGGILRTQCNMANVIYQSGDIERAKKLYGQAIKSAEQCGQQGLQDNCQINYAAALFQAGDYTEAIGLYEKTHSASKARKDYALAGTAIFYAGQAYLRMNKIPQTIKSTEAAISAWKMLEEKPPQMAQAQELLNMLRTTPH